VGYYQSTLLNVCMYQGLLHSVFLNLNMSIYEFHGQVGQIHDSFVFCECESLGKLHLILATVPGGVWCTEVVFPV